MDKFLVTIFLMVLPTTQFLNQGAISSSTFTFINKCDQTIWPGILSNAGIAPLHPTGFALQKDDSKVLNAPSSWGGRLWGRTNCSVDSDGNFTCFTGDCKSGKIECTGGAASPPATLAKFILGEDGGMDAFLVSLVGGYNLPMLVAPSGGSGNNCTSTGCTVDLNGMCPSTLKVVNSDGEVVACKSTCVAFGRNEDCCRGAYGSRETCKPSSCSQLFKAACPDASSFAYDDKSTTFTCTAADYHITFCPTSTTSKKSKEKQQTPTAPQFNTGMVNESNVTGNSNASPASPWSTIILSVIGVIIFIAVIILGVGGACTLRTGSVNINVNRSCNWF